MVISLLVTCLVIVVVCGILYWITTRLPAQFQFIGQILVALIALFWFLSAIGLWGPAWRVHVPR